MKDRIELAKYFTELGFKTGVEIGVSKGAYSRELCQTNPKLKLYCVDTWGIHDRSQGRRDLHMKIYKYAKWKLSRHNTVLIRDLSMNAVKQFDDNSLDFIYIDANHTYECVMEDIISWTPKVRAGVIVSGHDYQLPEVKRAVDDYIKDKNIDLVVTEQDTIREHPSWLFIKKL